MKSKIINNIVLLYFRRQKLIYCKLNFNLLNYFLDSCRNQFLIFTNVLQFLNIYLRIFQYIFKKGDLY